MRHSDTAAIRELDWNSHVLPLDQHLDESINCPFAADADVERLAATHGTVFSLLMFEREGIHAVRTDQHEVVVQICRRTRRDLERFVAARSYSSPV